MFKNLGDFKRYINNEENDAGMMPAMESFDLYNNVEIKKEDEPEMPYIPTKNFDTRMPYPFAVRANQTGGNDYDIYICRDIVSESTFMYLIIATLNNMTEKDTANFYIDSPGGSVDTIAMLINACLNTKATTHGYIIGDAASAAAMLFSVMDELHVSKMSMLMYHMSSHGDWGNSVLIRERADHVVSYMIDSIKNTALQRGLITQEEYTDILESHRDLFLYGETLHDRVANAVPLATLRRK